MNLIPPIRREIFLRAEPSAVFGCFTDDVGRWRPVGSHSVFGDGSRVSFEPEVLVEESEGYESGWGIVLGRLAERVEGCRSAQVRRWQVVAPG